MRLVIIDVDGSVAGQPYLSSLIAAGSAERVDMRALGPKLRIFATRRTMRRFRRRLPERSAQRGPEVFFYGSGDFHHLTAALLRRVAEPLTVLHFDNHPDWVRFPPTYNCGSWVNRALSRRNVMRVITLGPASADLVRPELKTANLRALSQGRLEVYPWRHEPSRVYLSYPSSPSAKYEKGYLKWRTLEGLNWPQFVESVVARIPTKAVWITIDKDVLTLEDAVTNWDQGGMPLQHILDALPIVAARRRIVGVDVCGDYGPRVFADPMRRILAHLDGPDKAPPSQAQLAINDSTNRRIVEALNKILASPAP